MDRIIRFLDAAHRIWGALALVVFALLAYDAWAYFTHQPGSPSRALLITTWRYVGEHAGLLEKIDNGSAKTASGGGPVGIGSSDAPAPRERSNSGGLPVRSSASTSLGSGSSAGRDTQQDAETAGFAFVSWSCAGEAASKDEHQRIARFPSLSKLTSSRQRLLALRELEVRLRCDYEAQQAAGKFDTVSPTTFEEWRQAALQQRYGPGASRIDFSELPRP
jgi:hypothetical protein